ncbi:hypothetical protein [Aquimarina sp. MMG016]|uniref:hypothetical protein n=1 Tax=Aquimarina sp. MMG016 TaxID=2822690 RepID=UPI001B3A34DB|nr:hypothetical protein [Aquimarina sp. MMG016]MBQ4821181.1 hypothetical protein [Aquimarina sp. MMG016]
MTLITYVLVTVANLISPAVNEHSLVLNILVVFFAIFIGVCYYIYLNSKTVTSYSLMVAASCFLIVNIVTALHRLYVPLDVFPVITNLLQISGQFFLVKFFIEQHNLVPSGKDYF